MLECLREALGPALRIGRENRGVALLWTDVTPRYLDVPMTAALAYLALC